MSRRLRAGHVCRILNLGYGELDSLVNRGILTPATEVGLRWYSEDQISKLLETDGFGPDWITSTEAREIMCVSRETLHTLARRSRVFHIPLVRSAKIEGLHRIRYNKTDALALGQLTEPLEERKRTPKHIEEALIDVLGDFD